MERERDWVYYMTWAVIIPISKTCVCACMRVCVRTCVCVCTHVCVRVCLLSPVEGHRRDTYPLISLIKECCHPLMLFFSFPQQFVICFIWFYHIPGFAAIRRPSLL